jgi:hypothetical protein
MDWQLVSELHVPARPRGLWTLVVDFVIGPALLKVEADGGWRYAPSCECGPDGDLLALIMRERCLYEKAPIGALIGKIGGSTAGIDDGTVFLAGSFCVVRVPDAGGPLFLTINDEYSGYANNESDVTVRVSLRPAPPVPKATSAPPTS